jgi:hypothetical protein
MDNFERITNLQRPILTFSREVHILEKKTHVLEGMSPVFHSPTRAHKL